MARCAGSKSCLRTAGGRCLPKARSFSKSFWTYFGRGRSLRCGRPVRNGWLTSLVRGRRTLSGRWTRAVPLWGRGPNIMRSPSMLRIVRAGSSAVLYSVPTGSWARLSARCCPIRWRITGRKSRSYAC